MVQPSTNCQSCSTPFPRAGPPTIFIQNQTKCCREMDKSFIASAKGYPKTTTGVTSPKELTVAELTSTQAAIGTPGEENLFSNSPR